jgi:hypothetical protein
MLVVSIDSSSQPVALLVLIENGSTENYKVSAYR